LTVNKLSVNQSSQVILLTVSYITVIVLYFNQHLSAVLAGQSGTTIKFNPPSGQDGVIKGGVSTNISTRHQCISSMKEYEAKSLEVII